MLRAGVAPSPKYLPSCLVFGHRAAHVACMLGLQAGTMQIFVKTLTGKTVSAVHRESVGGVAMSMPMPGDLPCPPACSQQWLHRCGLVLHGWPLRPAVRSDGPSSAYAKFCAEAASALRCRLLWRWSPRTPSTM